MSSTATPLHNQLAHLAERVRQVRAMPMLARAACVDELVALQLDLFGALIDRIEPTGAPRHDHG